MNTSTTEWKPVPVEPTPAMIEAGATERITLHASAGHGAIATYKAMIAAAPAPSAPGDAQEYRSPANVAFRIEQYLVRDGRKYSAIGLLREAMNALRAPAAGDALPTIKGAAITGGYVVVTTRGWDADRAVDVRDAILRLFPVDPTYTPKPEDAVANKEQ